MMLPSSGPKIDSPFAYYSSTGQLYCKICDGPVKNAKFWTAHVNGRQHRLKVIALKSQDISKPGPSTQRGVASVTSSVALGLLKTNGPKSAVGVPPQHSEKTLKQTRKHKSSIPSDFFDSSQSNGPSSKKVRINSSSSERKKGLGLADYGTGSSGSDSEMETDSTVLPANQQTQNLNKTEPSSSSAAPEVLPEGFFDDPIMDAKARNVEYKDPIEAELEKFQKEVVQQEAQISEAIAEEDEQEGQLERQLAEIDIQIEDWRRINELEEKRESVACSTDEKELENEQKRGASDENEEIIGDDLWSWRAKKVDR